MYGHPVIVHTVAVALTVPTLFKQLGKAAKEEVVELKSDIKHAVKVKNALIKTPLR